MNKPSYGDYIRAKENVDSISAEIGRLSQEIAEREQDLMGLKDLRDTYQKCVDYNAKVVKVYEEWEEAENHE